MAHIFGLPHDIGGVIDYFNPFSPASVPTATPNFTPIGPSGNLPTTGGGTIVSGTNPCNTGRQGKPKEYQIITTVHSDGTTSTKSVCKTRKRRRRLATTSDIRDLAALKSILGGGKAFDTWIATRGR